MPPNEALVDDGDREAFSIVPPVEGSALEWARPRRWRSNPGLLESPSQGGSPCPWHTPHPRRQRAQDRHSCQGGRPPGRQGQLPGWPPARPGDPLKNTDRLAPHPRKSLGKSPIRAVNTSSRSKPYSMVRSFTIPFTMRPAETRRPTDMATSPMTRSLLNRQILMEEDPRDSSFRSSLSRSHRPTPSARG